MKEVKVESEDIEEKEGRKDQGKENARDKIL